MRDILGRNWWAVLIRGIAAVVFGILAIAWPAHTLVALIILFGAYALVDGVFSIIAAIRAAEHHSHWFALLAEGVLGIIVGLIAFIHPGIAAVAFVYFIAAWAIITGVLELFAAVRLRRELGGEILLILGGIASVVFGILLAVFP
ncbi:MAG TPA: HdeD family acid-resistance protein, partial [Dehalococcoidia bacterium]|nr:HdeD family acid-resistance protein [Dehalococcoidia bacterium]